MFTKRIAERRKIRAELAKSKGEFNPAITFLLMSESLDDYLEHQIKSDKIREGILKEENARQGRMEKLALKILKERNLSS